MAIRTWVLILWIDTLDMSSRGHPQARALLVNIDGEKYFEKDFDTSKKMQSRDLTGWHVSTSENRFKAAQAGYHCVYGGKSTLFVQGDVPKVQILEIVDQLNFVYPKTPGLSAFLTSGSTGRPKIIVHSVENFFESAKKILVRHQSVADKIWHHFFPINYMAGILNSLIVPWESGGSVLLDEAFNFSTPLKLMNKQSNLNSSIAWLSPSMIASLSKFAIKKTGSSLNWDFIFSATGPLDTTIRDNFRRDLGVDVINTYGSTEQMFISGEVVPNHEVSCGKAFSGVSLEIVPKSGTIRVKSDVIASGVFTWSATLQNYEFKEFNRNDPLETADVGSILDGCLYVHGRTDSIVVLGGLNVSLSAIEDVARSLPDVLEAFAWAPNGGSQRDLHLFLDVVENFDDDIMDFRNQLNLRLGVEQAPKKIFAFPLPRTNSGKIDRQKLIAFASKERL